jgi:hypothetical protein
VHDAKLFEVDRLLDVAFKSNGIGLFFKVRWTGPFNVPSEVTWEPMQGVDHLDIFSDIFSDIFELMSIETFLRGMICLTLQSLACKNPEDTKILSAA